MKLLAGDLDKAVPADQSEIQLLSDSRLEKSSFSIHPMLVSLQTSLLII